MKRTAFWNRKWRAGCAVAVMVGALAGGVRAQEIYHDVSLAELAYDEGAAPPARSWDWVEDETYAVLEPIVRLEGEGEAYVDWEDTPGAQFHLGYVGSHEAFRRMHVGAMVSPGKPARGVLYLPDESYSGFTRHPFSLEPGEGSADDRETFLQRKLGYYQRKASHGFPGASWFRHQAALVRAELDGESFWGSSPEVRRWRTSRDIDETFELFSGGRAVSENLALDSEFDPEGSEKDFYRQHRVDKIRGVTTSPINWAPLVEGLEPELDSLARFLPHDQHALFFSSFDALTTLVDEAQENGTPLLHLLEPRAEDAGTQERYERQLCLELTALARMFGPAMVKSVAITGSDPYLRTGSDVAILFEAQDGEILRGYLRERQRVAMEESSDAAPVQGTIDGLEWSGVLSEDRAIASFVLRIDDFVCVTNNLDQLGRLVSVYRGETPSLAGLDEYRFFRDRYPRGAEGETAFFLLTDATLRRWMGPRWRIGASRRTRAAALMAQYQAANAEKLLAGEGRDQVIEDDLAVPGGGDLFLSSDGVVSPEYGTLAHLTPIVSLDLDKVTTEEHQAYERFRRAYEGQWSRFFDPIAASVEVGPERLTLDVTVMPLVARTEYQELLDLSGAAKLAPEAGQAREDALITMAMSLDHEGRTFRELEGGARMIMPSEGELALSWVGDYLSVYVDREEFWSELAAAEDHEAFMEENGHRLPIGLEVGVGNPLKLAVFLTSLRAFVGSAAPDMLVWETREHLGRSYVRIALDDSTDFSDDFGKYALHYAVLPDAWLFSMNEGVIQRAIGRVVAARDAEETAAGGKDEAGPRPWLGESAALRLDSDALDVVRALGGRYFRDRMRLRAWKSLPILEEWRRLFPDRDPLEVHRELWSTRLQCPGGGEYVWNEALGAMESTVYGSPFEPREGPELPAGVRSLRSIDLGLTFENDGLRARGEVHRAR